MLLGDCVQFVSVEDQKIFENLWNLEMESYGTVSL
jgi:hypothetical protein